MDGISSLSRYIELYESIDFMLITSRRQVEQRGLLVFRNQEEFINRGPEFYKEWGRHFGRSVFDDLQERKTAYMWTGSLHIHPTSGHPAGYPEIHLVHWAAESKTNFDFYDNSITATGWHSDVSYELQPPGVTTFFLLGQPKTGGDTLFTNQVQTLKKLSPQFVAFLRTLKAVHSGFEQAEYARRGGRGGIVRRDPVQNIHPVVRRHPVTGEEALYVNRQFTRRIVGLKREESGMSVVLKSPRCN
jgi:sulfonate dioxygenase